MQTRLVEQARDGDEGAFTELVGITGDRCYAIAYRVLRDHHRVQDAVQHAYLQAWRELPSLRDPERFEAWLYRLLINSCYEEARRHRRWTTRVQSLPLGGSIEPVGEDSAVTVEERDSLDRAFSRLTPEQRAVFVLHHHVGAPLALIAEIVGAPVGTVKSRLHYASRILRDSLTSDDQPVAVEVRSA
jgi:RNA polymerase sigma-70 factor, ECF subfamily